MSNQKMVQCFECSNQVDEEDLEGHLRQHLQYPGVQCRLCPAMFFVRDDLEHHFDSKHDGQAVMFAEKRDDEMDRALAELTEKSKGIVNVNDEDGKTQRRPKAAVNYSDKVSLRVVRPPTVKKSSKKQQRRDVGDKNRKSKGVGRKGDSSRKRARSPSNSSNSSGNRSGSQQSNKRKGKYSQSSPSPSPSPPPPKQSSGRSRRRGVGAIDPLVSIPASVLRRLKECEVFVSRLTQRQISAAGHGNSLFKSASYKQDMETPRSSRRPRQQQPYPASMLMTPSRSSRRRDSGRFSSPIASSSKKLKSSTGGGFGKTLGRDNDDFNSSPVPTTFGNRAAALLRTPKTDPRSNSNWARQQKSSSGPTAVTSTPRSERVQSSTSGEADSSSRKRVCRICYEKVERNRREHVIMRHMNENAIKCSHCDAATIWYPSKLKKHLKESHNGKAEILDNRMSILPKIDETVRRCFPDYDGVTMTPKNFGYEAISGSISAAGTTGIDVRGVVERRSGGGGGSSSLLKSAVKQSSSSSGQNRRTGRRYHQQQSSSAAATNPVDALPLLTPDFFKPFATAAASSADTPKKSKNMNAAEARADKGGGSDESTGPPELVELEDINKDDPVPSSTAALPPVSAAKSSPSESLKKTPLENLTAVASKKSTVKKSSFSSADKNNNSRNNDLDVTKEVKNEAENDENIDDVTRKMTKQENEGERGVLSSTKENSKNINSSMSSDTDSCTSQDITKLTATLAEDEIKSETADGAIPDTYMSGEVMLT